MSIDVTAAPIVMMIDRFANLEYWKEIVSAVQTTAKCYGLIFVEGAVPAPLSEEVQNRLSYAASHARLKFLHPNLSQQTLEREVAADIETGFAWRYANCILRALNSEGITLIEEPAPNPDQRGK
jgi:hypothetical protein